MKRRLNLTNVIFIVYLLILIWLILFKMSFSFNDISLLSRTRSVNLLPFCNIRDIGGIQVKEIIMNIVVFIPMGIYLKMNNVTNIKTVLYGISSSFVFELIQFLFAIGTSDITDLTTNTMGIVVGLFVYALFRKIFVNKEKTDRVINRIAIIVFILFSILLSLLIFMN